jgi:hypothetical protein
MKRRLLFIGLLMLLPLAALADTTGSSNFVPLTSLPGLSAISQTNSDFISFFNNLYKVCIGFAAVLALLQIIRAGIEWMAAGDNTERVSHARTLITNSVFGLILVLSPVIIFSIINPNVLSLQLNVSGLNSGSAAPASNSTTAASTAANANNGNPANASLSNGGDCENNAEACGTGFICQVNNDGDDTCVSTTGATGQKACDVGSVAANASCVSCSDGSTADTAGDCPAANAAPADQTAAPADTTGDNTVDTTGDDN